MFTILLFRTCRGLFLINNLTTYFVPNTPPNLLPLVPSQPRSTRMNVQIQLDPHGQYTNLDLVTGRVILHNPSTTTISHITVKLEAESRTRLLAPPSQDPRQNRRNEPRPLLEIHKVHHTYSERTLACMCADCLESASLQSPPSLSARRYASRSRPETRIHPQSRSIHISISVQGNDRILSSVQSLKAQYCMQPLPQFNLS